MVMALVTDLGRVRPVCLSRFYLNRAHEALEAGNTIEAGCLLREAIQRYLWALCLYHKVDTQLAEIHRTPGRLLKALCKAKQFTKDGAEWVSDAIKFGNKLAHCKPVKASLVECSISFIHCLLDSSDELIFPTRGNGGAL